MQGGVQRGTGPRLTDSAEVCIRTAAQHEPPPEANVKVVLISRTGLHVIVAVLGFAIVGCICALAYSFGNYSKLKANVEHVRSYIASRRVQVGADHLHENSVPGGVGTGRGPLSYLEDPRVGSLGNWVRLCSRKQPGFTPYGAQVFSVSQYGQRAREGRRLGQ
ncbi:hypothetical protein HPB50_023529 [Hyalomma asiaticum]|uniref:Uncharacterized protein n=1 Tax=Hyalomma asiaticum TaxID=266040 RepID=A0ACB7RZS4_HYAAI|nr:hypothetical protein HPB50_023529 [Hyalomma asiaticum]